MKRRLTPEDKALDERFAADLVKRRRLTTPTLLQLSVDNVLKHLTSYPREMISIKLPRSIHAMLYENRIKSESRVPRGTFQRFICDSLKSLSLSGRWHHDQESLEETITLLESHAHGSLKSLDMRWIKTDLYEYPLYNPISNYNQERRILASQPNIEKIVVLDQEILRLLPTHTPQLKSLAFVQLSDNTFSDLKFLTSLKDLTHLVLSWDEGHGTANSDQICKCEEQIMMFLENLPNLEQLKTPCNGVHWSLLNYIEKYRQSRPLKLQYFKTHSIDSDQISVIVKHLPDLKHLRIVNYPNFQSLIVLRRLGDVKLTKLEYQIISQVRGNRTENLEDFSHFITYAGEKLQLLSLTSGNFVVDLSEIGRFCPEICHIKLDRVNVPEENKYDVGKQSFSKLETCQIYSETKFPEAVLLHLLTRPSLEVFVYENQTTPISTRGFETVLHSARNNEEVFSNLRSLGFTASAGINIEMLLELICLAPNLTSFSHDDWYNRTRRETKAVRTMEKFLNRHGIQGNFF